MAHRSGLLLISVLLAAAGAVGQIRPSAKNPPATISGTLRRISDDDLVVQTDDKAVMTIALGITTKYYKASGAMIKAAELQPGDRLNIEATRDDNGRYRAMNVNQAKVGTPAERAAASKPVESSPAPKDSQNVSSDPNDPGPPSLKRGVPRPSIHAGEVNGVTRTPDPPQVGASAADSDRVIFPQSGDPVIDRAREAAFTFSRMLPNFVVQQFTTRYETFAAHAGQTSWRALDTVTADVVSEDGRESYKNILVNGKPPKESIEKTGGTWSTGEYSSVQLDILSPGTRANFRNKRSTTIANRAAYLYDLSVERANSHWNVVSNSDTYVPEYTGAIWIDKENSRVLRIEMSARNMPRTFKLDTVESAIDYDYVPIGDAKFLLPVHSEALSCDRGANSCSRNTIDFRNYKKFTADTSITFDADADKNIKDK